MGGGTDVSQAIAICQGLLDEGYIDLAIEEDAVEATGKIEKPRISIPNST